MYIASTKKLHIVVECDENQHQWENYSCETGRMNEILDEIKEGRVVFIRWNPDHCKMDGKAIFKKRKVTKNVKKTNRFCQK